MGRRRRHRLTIRACGKLDIEGCKVICFAITSDNDMVSRVPGRTISRPDCHSKCSMGVRLYDEVLTMLIQTWVHPIIGKGDITLMGEPLTM